MTLQVVAIGWGEAIKASTKKAVSGPSLRDMQEKILRREFAAFDMQRNGRMDVADLEELLENVGYELSERDREGDLLRIQRLLDPEDEGIVAYDALWKWYQLEVDDGADEEDEDSGEEEEGEEEE